MVIETLSLKKNTALVETTLQNDLLVYDPVLRTAYVLNATARKVWDLIGQDNDPNTIITAFKDAFGTETETDLGVFFEKLETSGLAFSGDTSEPSSTSNNTAIDFTFEYTAPTVEAYSEEFLRTHLNDEAFATFHDDTYSDIATR